LSLSLYHGQPQGPSLQKRMRTEHPSVLVKLKERRDKLKRKTSILRFCYEITLIFFSITIFFIFSCSNQGDITLRYKIEKELYNSERLRQVLFINLKAASPEDFKRVIHSYQKVLDLSTSQAKIPLEMEIQDLAASALLRIAELQFLQKEFDSAMESFQKVLHNYPEVTSKNKSALSGIARIYYEKKEKEKAVETYHQLLENYPPIIKKNQPDPDLFAIPNHLIQLYSPQEEKAKREGEFEYALNYYQNLIQSHPHTQISFAATLSLARAYQIQGRWKESINILETATDSTGEVPGPVLLQIGNIYYDELKDEKNAFSTFHRVLSSSVDSLSQAEAQMKIGMIYFQKKDYAEAKSELAKVNRFYPRATPFVATSQYLIAQIYEKGGEWERALNEYNWLMVNNPLSPEGLDAPLRIVSYYQIENPALVTESYEKGLKHYEELLNKYEDKPFAYQIEFQRVKLLVLLKDWDKAISSLQNIAEKHSGTEAGLNALLNLYRIYKSELKDERKSKELFARISSEYPGIVLDTLRR
jgi:tetratricopeptide (TPR) repeat protein